MKNKTIESMTISAIIIAIIALMSFVPYVGYISIPGTPISICTIHIVVILAAILFGWKQGLVAGLTFGLLSLLRAACMPAAPSDVLFVNPMVSVVPRVLFGLFAGLTFDYLRRIKNIGARTVCYVLGCIFSTLVHTVLVLFMLWVFNRDILADGFMLIMGTVFTINGFIEIVSAAIIAPTLAKTIGLAKKKYNPYGQLTNMHPITIEPIVFALILLGEVVLITFYGTWQSVVPLVITVVYITARIIIRKRKLNE